MHHVPAALRDPSRLRCLAPLFRRGRLPGIRTAKTTIAAVLAFVAASALGTSQDPVLAPLTALLVVRLTLYETVASGLQRVGSVLAGVLIAVGVAELVGLTWWSLGAVVAACLVLGRALRLGDNVLEVPISAMIVLVVGGSATVAAGRVYETLIGAAVGVAVNLVIVPPLYVQPAEDALGELADQMAEFLHALAEQLRTGWSREAADRWLDRARALGSEVARADEMLTRAEQSARLNPRAGRARLARPRLRIGLTGLEHLYVSLRGLSRALLDRTFFVPAEEADAAYSVEVRSELADVLDATARASASIGGYTSWTVPAERALADTEAALRDVDEARNRLEALLLAVIDPVADPASWQQHGTLLSAIDRLRVEIRAATRRTDETWRPRPVTELPRQAVRQAAKVRWQRVRGARRLSD